MQPPPPRKNRRWIWFFVVVFALALVATAVLIAFNLGQQLKPEQLAAARKMWQEKGPPDYTLAYTTQRNHEAEDHYLVKVRGGKVVESVYNGRPEVPERFAYRGMERLFDFIEEFMKKDSEKGAPRAYVRAYFDDQKTGGLRWYVRSVMGERQRVEITVKSFTVPGSE